MKYRNKCLDYFSITNRNEKRLKIYFEIALLPNFLVFLVAVDLTFLHCCESIGNTSSGHIRLVMRPKLSDKNFLNTFWPFCPQLLVINLVVQSSHILKPQQSVKWIESTFTLSVSIWLTTERNLLLQLVLCSSVLNTCLWKQGDCDRKAVKI